MDPVPYRARVTVVKLRRVPNQNVIGLWGQKCPICEGIPDAARETDAPQVKLGITCIIELQKLKLLPIDPGSAGWIVHDLAEFEVEKILWRIKVCFRDRAPAHDR